MYQNHIRRATPKITPNSHPQFFIRRSEITVDPRVTYIESVCASLVESRFGPGCVLPVSVNWSDRLELEPVPLSDLCDDGELVSSYDLAHLSFLGRKILRRTQDGCLRSDKFSGTHGLSAKQMGLLDAEPNMHHSTSALSPNQGRGSP